MVEQDRTVADWVEHIPMFAHRVLIIGSAPENSIIKLRQRDDVEVFHVVSDFGNDSFEKGTMDCVYVSDPSTIERTALIGFCTSMLAQNGHLWLPIPQDWYSKQELQENPQPDTLPLTIVDLLDESGFAVLGAWSELHSPYPYFYFPDQNTPYLSVAVLVLKSYDPFRHARDFLVADCPEWAYEVLKSIPETSITDPNALIAYHLECLKCIESMFDRSESEISSCEAVIARRLDLLFKAHYTFTSAIAASPHLIQAYSIQARLWFKLGVPLQAKKLLSNIQSVAPNEALCIQISEYSNVSKDPSKITPPEWRPSQHVKNVLMVIPRCPDYGLDVLYDGLCSVLGDENVTEYPWKPMLHGANLGIGPFSPYPCGCCRKGESQELEEILQALRQGKYDVVLLPNYPDHDQFLKRDIWSAVAAAARNHPIFLVDQDDEFINRLPEAQEAPGNIAIRGYFKREMLDHIDYGPLTFPMPFAYPEKLVAEDIANPRTQTVFWAGTPDVLRGFYLDRVEALTGEVSDRKYSPEEYIAVLDNSQIAVAVAGWGFDTVRYWEVPARGCMLLTERFPTIIPHNFEDGISAVLCRDAQEMEEKLKYYLAHPDEIREIAKAGHAHLKRYHTASVRAKQLLAWIEKLI